LRLFLLYGRINSINDVYLLGCVSYQNEPTAQTAHLVFADTRANAKIQKSCFLQEALIIISSYDLLNATILNLENKEEMALTLNGRKNRF